MMVRICTQSGATPDLGGWHVISRDGDLYVWVDAIDQLWKLRETCGHDIAIVVDGFRVIDDYWD